VNWVIYGYGNGMSMKYFLKMCEFLPKLYCTL